MTSKSQTLDSISPRIIVYKLPYKDNETAYRICVKHETLRLAISLLHMEEIQNSRRRGGGARLKRASQVISLLHKEFSIKEIGMGANSKAVSKGLKDSKLY